MKTLTVTLTTDPAATPPANAAGFVGFKLSLKKVATNQAVEPPLSTDLVWTFGNLVEGDQLILSVKSVNGSGQTIVGLADIPITVPSGVAYIHLSGVSLAWA